ncbi:hypothetical protein HYW42_05425 [Candidatus Daviesbacteria bacterium]|nr:hypothetical protein [Candidatus Daviesbacteria bacterium]
MNIEEKRAYREMVHILDGDSLLKESKRVRFLADSSFAIVLGGFIEMGFGVGYSASQNLPPQDLIGGMLIAASAAIATRVTEISLYKHNILIFEQARRRLIPQYSLVQRIFIALNKHTDPNII